MDRDRVWMDGGSEAARLLGGGGIVHRRRFLRIAGASAATAILAACGGSKATAVPSIAPTVASAGSAASSVPTVMVLSPKDGETVASPDVTVTFRATGVTIATADSKDTPGVAHYHVILDDTVTPGQPIARDETHVHTTETTTILKGVKPGPHTIRVDLANGLHVPLANPQALQSIAITVR